MKAFIGLLMCSFLSLPGELLDDEGEVEEFDPPDDWGDICVIADIAPNDEDIPEIFEPIAPLSPAIDDMEDMLCMADIDMGTLLNMLVLELLPYTVIIHWSPTNLDPKATLYTHNILHCD